MTETSVYINTEVMTKDGNTRQAMYV